MKRIGPTTSLAKEFEGLRAEYAASKASKFRRNRNVPLMGASGDYHFASPQAYYTTMEYALDMDRNDAAIGPIVDQSVNNVVQDGFTLDPQTGSEDANSYIRAKFWDWAEDAEQCDIQGEHTFYDFERLVDRSTIVAGDHVVIPLRDGQMQSFEAYRVKTPSNTSKNVILGVLVDGFRKRQEYWITKDDIGITGRVTRVSDVQPYKVRDENGNRNLFHIYDPKRTTQTRGVTAFAPIMDIAGMFEDTQFAAVIKQQIATCITMFRERDINYTAGASAPVGSRETETRDDGTTEVIENWAPGRIIDGKPGEKLSGFSPNVPGPEFLPHVKFILTLMGINLGIPLVMSLMDGSETNFSSWRGSVELARVGFRLRQKARIQRFHTPVYRWKIREWLNTDPAIQAFAKQKGVNLFAHQWKPPAWNYIDPLKDAMADDLRLSQGLTSPRRLHSERNGADWEEIYRETVDDRKAAFLYAIEAAEEINAAHPDLPGGPVLWHMLINVPAPKTFNFTELIAASKEGDDRQQGGRDA